MGATPNGIILPRIYRGRVIGAALGITTRELALAPKEINLVLAHPKDEAMAAAQLYWLENCPPTGEYSTEACAYWLLPHFSRLGETRNSAIRIKPNEKENGYGYDAIFWSQGKPISLGEQYSTGAELVPRFLKGRTLHQLVDAWENEQYEIESALTLGELSTRLKSIVGEYPQVQFDNAEHELRLQARDAGWNATRPLVRQFV